MANIKQSGNLAARLGMKGLDDRDPPSLEVIVTYLVGRAYQEGKSKDDVILMVRKSWEENVG